MPMESVKFPSPDACNAASLPRFHPAGAKHCVARGFQAAGPQCPLRYMAMGRHPKPFRIRELPRVTAKGRTYPFQGEGTKVWSRRAAAEGRARRGSNNVTPAERGCGDFGWRLHAGGAFGSARRILFQFNRSNGGHRTGRSCHDNETCQLWPDVRRCEPRLSRRSPLRPHMPSPQGSLRSLS
jgi:hypothetical protein